MGEHSWTSLAWNRWLSFPNSHELRFLLELKRQGVLEHRLQPKDVLP